MLKARGFGEKWVKTLADGYDYKLGEFPWQFLHMPNRPLGPIREDWLPTIQKVDRKLVDWKGATLSKGID